MKALLDTDSPVTLVSLEFLVETLLEKKHVGQSTDDSRAN